MRLPAMRSFTKQFKDRQEAQAFADSDPLPEGMHWGICLDVGNLPAEYIIPIIGGRSEQGSLCLALFDDSTFHPALSTPDKWTLESGDPLPP